MIVFDDDAFAGAAAEEILATANAALAAHNAFHVALAGGSTPKAIHRRLTGAVHDFTRWHVYFGDERLVPAAHPDSNYRMARETLLDHVPIPTPQIHPVPTETGDPAAVAAAYAETLRRALPRASGSPRFDLVLLGLGNDGHTASLFPGTTALAETERWVVANDVPALSTTRITLTYPVLNAARRVAFLVSGAGKRDILARVTAGEALPATRVAAERVDWIVDRSAAGS